jgi:hypothetical protein
MHVLLIVIGLLLAVFGGGCVLIVAFFFVQDPGALVRDLDSTGYLFAVLGVLPLAAGLILFRYGMKIDREKRARAAEEFRNSQKGPK